MVLLQNMTEKAVVVSGRSIAYSEGPDNGPALVLVHGVTSRRDSYAPVTRALLPHFHLFAIDMRGHGLSDHVTGHYHITDYASDLIEFIEKVPGSPALVWGHSLGAATAIAAAGMSPGTFRAVVLEDPPLGSARGRSVMMNMFEKWLELAREDLSVEELVPRVSEVDPRFTEAYARFKAETLHQLDPDVLEHTVGRKTFTNFSFEDAIRKVACPAFLMQGDPEHGGVIADELLESLQPLPDNFTHRKFTGAGHGIHNDQPDLTVQTALEFFAKAGVSAGV